HVVAADGHSAVGGAAILLSEIGEVLDPMWINFAIERGRTNDAGVFVLDQVPPWHRASYTVFAVTPEALGWAKLPVAAGRADATDIEIVLRPAGAATVTVTDASGAPRGWVKVIASP